jgi:uncharacterized protein YjbJ (UPF0337 family)
MQPISLKLDAPWKKVKEKMKENDSTLTDDDLNYVLGKENELLEHLANKMRKDKWAVKAYIESISANSHIAS